MQPPLGAHEAKRAHACHVLFEEYADIYILYDDQKKNMVKWNFGQHKISDAASLYHGTRTC